MRRDTRARSRIKVLTRFHLFAQLLSTRDHMLKAEMMDVRRLEVITGTGGADSFLRTSRCRWLRKRLLRAR